MTNEALNIENTDDAHAWADAFIGIWGKSREDIDEALMVTWFANAIESACSVRKRRDHTTLIAKLRGMKAYKIKPLVWVKDKNFEGDEIYNAENYTIFKPCDQWAHLWQIPGTFTTLKKAKIAAEKHYIARMEEGLDNTAIDDIIKMLEGENG